jgi:large subunit ribosomal protein L4
MRLNVQNADAETVGTVDVNDEVFGGRVKTDVIWAAVVQQNASERRGTHATKSRGLVSGSGKKPYKQKGTGRPQVGSTRTPLWRKGGTVFGPQPRSHEFDMPKKVRVGAVRAALAQKLRDGQVIVVDKLEAGEDAKTKDTAGMLKRWGVSGKAVVIDVKQDDRFVQSARNIAGVRLASASRVTARDIVDTNHVIVTREALEKLQQSLALL